MDVCECDVSGLCRISKQSQSSTIGYLPLQQWTKRIKSNIYRGSDSFVIVDNRVLVEQGNASRQSESRQITTQDLVVYLFSAIYTSTQTKHKD